MKPKRILLLACVTAGLAIVGCNQLDKALLDKHENIGLDGATNAPSFTVKPMVESGTQIVSGLPVPYAGVAGIVLGFAASIYASIRNRQVSVALVQGIEAGRKVLQETDEGRRLDSIIKDKLIEHQEVNNVLGSVSKIVAKYTDNTVK